MQIDMWEGVRELCVRSQRESDVETVAEIVDRVLNREHAFEQPVRSSQPTSPRPSLQTTPLIPPMNPLIDRKGAARGFR
jgi:hypothetical protein